MLLNLGTSTSTLLFGTLGYLLTSSGGGVGGLGKTSGLISRSLFLLGLVGVDDADEECRWMVSRPIVGKLAGNGLLGFLIELESEIDADCSLNFGDRERGGGGTRVRECDRKRG
jgi:hypothetical protein